MNEFDRFVRHNIKPLGYLRYGDDFILFEPSRLAAVMAQSIAKAWLLDNLKLQIHARNNVLIKASQGLHFLGHRIYPSSISVSPALLRKINQQIAVANTASYQAQRLPHNFRSQLPWILDQRLH
ncbi:MAG: hypothetical protein ACREGA_03845 [Candidatus Saccharimonadales bacterium]